ncbi:MAG: copper chaperone PCu(A)C [Rhodothermales bacterium]
MARPVFLLLIGLILASCRPDPGPPRLRIVDAWTPPLNAEAPTGAVYLTLYNDGGPDTLLTASTDAAERVELHESREEQGMMRMRRLDALPLPPRSETRLEPGGKHLMLVGFTPPAGDTLALRLHFSVSGERTVAVALEGSRF